MSEWISVKDRLPEAEFETPGVLLYVEIEETYGKHQERKHIYHDMFHGYWDGTEWYTTWCYGCERISKTAEKHPYEIITVTHWMPLPEPPEDVTNE